MASFWLQHQFTIVVAFLQVMVTVLFCLFAKYDSFSMPEAEFDGGNSARQYPLFQDVNAMIFVGVGFLLTFLKRYGYSALSINLLVASFTVEWAIICRGFLSEEFKEHGKFAIGLEQLMSADFSAAVVVISMGVVLGKLSPIQYLMMALIETPVSVFIEYLVGSTLRVNDIGGSMTVHAFAAYFGLACSRILAKKEQRGHGNEGTTYHSDMFAMIGTLFLWVFWPSFNAALASPEDAKNRAVANTFLSMLACTIATFITSQATDGRKRFSMVHVANSSLAGGVAIGCSANVVLHPVHSMIVGALAGTISVLGYRYVTPFMSDKLSIHDTCGVHSLHGLPSLIGALSSVIFAVFYSPASYGTSLAHFYPGIADGSLNTVTQALMQLAALGVVLVASVGSGLVTGLILKLSVWQQVRPEEYYADGDFFEMPPDYDFSTVMTVSKTSVTATNMSHSSKEA